MSPRRQRELERVRRTNLGANVDNRGSLNRCSDIRSFDHFTKQSTDDHHVPTAHDNRCHEYHRSKGSSPQTATQAPRPAPLPAGSVGKTGTLQFANDVCTHTATGYYWLPAP